MATERIKKTLGHLQPDLCVATEQRRRRPETSKVETIIIGAGFGGLLTAIELKAKGHHDFVILDKAPKLGGTWEANRYPGVECDVSALSYLPMDRTSKFVPSNRYVGAEEIQRFMFELAEEHDLNRSLVNNCTVIRCEWDEETATWTVFSKEGHEFNSRFVVGALGPLSIPNVPDFRKVFRGETLHSASWPKHREVDLSEKTVAVVGTGSSAMQVVADLAPRVKKLYVFQRTAAYCFPKPMDNYKVHPALTSSLEERRRFMERKRQEGAYFADEVYLKLFGASKERNLKAYKKLLKAVVKDPVVREKLTPNYALGCKRPGFVNGYLEAFNQENVVLINEAVAKELPDGLQTVTGLVATGLDTIIYCTGFRPAEDMFDELIEVKGRYGARLRPSRDGFKSLYGIHPSPLYPNIFLIIGPQAFLVHGPSVLQIELHAEYVSQLINFASAQGFTRVTAPDEECDKYKQQVSELGTKSLWAGCRSWYNKQGEDFVGYAGKLSDYTMMLYQDAFSKLEFSDGKKTVRVTREEAPFVPAPHRTPPWPVFKSVPNDDFVDGF